MEIHNQYGHYQVLDSEGGVVCSFATLEAASVVMRYLMGVPQDADEIGKARSYIDAYDLESQRKDAERAAKKEAARQKAKARKEAKAAQMEGGASND